MSANQYDFLNLSPFEFELLTADLLSVREGIQFQAFASGADGGIDLRHSKADGEEIIVQCKRYARWSNLKSALNKSEVANAKKLKPKRYILVTSVALTNANKNWIKDLFSPYIVTTGDILGKEDLNSLLRTEKYKHLELQHHKLWMTSTTLLESILNRKVINLADMEKSRWGKHLRVFVKTVDFKPAYQHLLSERVIILTGAPGAGKSTLARALSATFLKKGYQEFIRVGRNMEDGYAAYKKGVKQIFFYDDFLGENWLKDELPGKESGSIREFIEGIVDADDKLLIMTTRDYIYKQAIEDFPKLGNAEIKKCVYKMQSTLSDIWVKAQILYQHVLHSNIENLELISILDKLQLILGHKNFTPRIIEQSIKLYGNCSIRESSLGNYLLSHLEYPEEIYKDTFEREISTNARKLLAVRMTLPHELILEDFRAAFDNFVQKFGTQYGILKDSLLFEKALREVEDTFIQLDATHVNAKSVNYENPSILDFLSAYHFDRESDNIELLESAIYFDQLYGVYKTQQYVLSKSPSNPQTKRWIQVSKNVMKVINRKWSEEFDVLKSCIVVSRYDFSEKSKKWSKEPISKFQALINFEIHFLAGNMDRYPEQSKTIKQLINRDENINNLTALENDAFLRLLRKYFADFTLDLEAFLRKSLEVTFSLSEFKMWETLMLRGNLYSDKFELMELQNSITQIWHEELRLFNGERIEQTLREMTVQEGMYGVNLSRYKEDAQKKHEEFVAYHDEIQNSQPIVSELTDEEMDAESDYYEAQNSLFLKLQNIESMFKNLLENS